MEYSNLIEKLLGRFQLPCIPLYTTTAVCLAVLCTNKFSGRDDFDDSPVLADSFCRVFGSWRKQKHQLDKFPFGYLPLECSATKPEVTHDKIFSMVKRIKASIVIQRYAVFGRTASQRFMNIRAIARTNAISFFRFNLPSDRTMPVIFNYCQDKSTLSIVRTTPFVCQKLQCATCPFLHGFLMVVNERSNKNTFLGCF